MRLRNLVILWVVLSLVVGLYTYMLTQEDYAYTLPFAIQGEQIQLTFPIALWVVLPVALFFVIVCIGVFLDKFKRNLEGRHFKSDFSTLIDQIHAQAAGESCTVSFKTEDIEKLSLVLHRFIITPEPNSIPSGVDKIDTFLTSYKALLDGETVDIRKLGISNNSPLVLLEKQNHLNKDTQYVLDVLRRNSESPAVIKMAFLTLLSTYDEENIKKYMKQIEIDEEVADALLQAITEKKIAYDSEQVFSLIDRAQYSSEEILRFVVKLKKILEPDAWLKFAEQLTTKNEIAEEAYLFVLADLEMISSLKDRLKLHTANEFMPIRAFVDLRDSGKNYPLNAFFVALS